MNFGTGTGGHDFEVAAIAAFLNGSNEEIASAASDEEQITTEVADSSYTGDGSQESAAEAAAIAFLRSSSEERAPADSGEERVPTEVEADDSSLDVDLPQEWVHSSDEVAEIADILRSSTEEALLPSPASSRHNLDSQNLRNRQLFTPWLLAMLLLETHLCLWSLWSVLRLKAHQVHHI